MNRKNSRTSCIISEVVIRRSFHWSVAPPSLETPWTGGYKWFWPPLWLFINHNWPTCPASFRVWALHLWMHRKGNSNFKINVSSIWLLADKNSNCWKRFLRLGCTCPNTQTLTESFQAFSEKIGWTLPLQVLVQGNFADWEPLRRAAWKAPSHKYIYFPWTPVFKIAGRFKEKQSKMISEHPYALDFGISRPALKAQWSNRKFMSPSA